ncbi:MAG TPA: saccharopine dehydrogenase C-terminal domain-containing protein [Thermoanaerobaculia bacterium]|jgi:saccharopine dehydrogenase-like NADP-dependent oxidoreductase|nr:saccharopine dehydrogenase C-terminal domain-containing protein [Thermoanaerobaculia bacterium]
MRKHTIVIAGAGGMGSATGLLLRELGDFEVDLYVGDADADRAHAAASWIREGSTRPGAVHAFHLPFEGVGAELEAALQASEILLDCLPGKEAPRMARLARQHDLHYANLTEHVKETEEVMEIAEGSERGFLLQTGLAPGFIDVLANGLFQQFCQEHKVEAVESISMRVGALTTTAHPPHYYGFTWSSIGVATEYVEPATVVRDSRRTTRPSLTDLAPILIDGIVYEEALTSGGAADLPIALEGRVKTLDYKTLRYPGHYGWVQRLLADAPQEGEDGERADYLLGRMTEAVPFVEDDLVVFYAAVDGFGADGIRRRLERSGLIRPIRVGARQLKAIQSTTAAGLAESARLLLTEGLRGVCLQSQIDPAHFMAGPFISTVYG